MRRVVKVGNIHLDYKMFVREDLSSNANVAVARRTVSGTVVVYEQKNRDTALYLTLDSYDSGWQRKNTVESLIALADASIGASVTVEFSDGSTRQCRFAYEQSGGAVQFAPLFEGSEWMTGKIYMGKA